MPSLPPLRRVLLLGAVCLGLGALPARADVVTTTEGLVLEGTARRTPAGGWVVETAQGEVRLPAARVVAVRPGEGPRARLGKVRAALADDDVQGWYRLAVEAESEGVPDLAREAYEHVVRLAPDHLAARRALGQVRVGGRWLPEDVARRRQGFVLFDGSWRLPAEVEKVARAEPAGPPLDATGDDSRIRTLIRTWATADEALAHAARVALATVPREQRLRAALGTLLDPDPHVRAASARLLGEIGDEAALRPLIFSAARDLDRDVRREATLAARSFGHEDTVVPFVRALSSTNPRLVAQAAQAIALLEDQRALPFLVKRLVSHGGAARSYVAFLDQVSYVQDYDVEVAQNSNIANPVVATALSGVVLDVKVIDAGFTETWLEPILVDAIGRLAGRSFHGTQDVLDWFEGAKDRIPAFPPPDGHPRRRTGRVLGVPLR